jgi:hypothetical protein
MLDQDEKANAKEKQNEVPKQRHTTTHKTRPEDLITQWSHECGTVTQTLSN